MEMACSRGTGAVPGAPGLPRVPVGVSIPLSGRAVAVEGLPDLCVQCNAVRLAGACIFCSAAGASPQMGELHEHRTPAVGEPPAPALFVLLVDEQLCCAGNALLLEAVWQAMQQTPPDARLALATFGMGVHIYHLGGLAATTTATTLYVFENFFFDNMRMGKKGRPASLYL